MPVYTRTLIRLRPGNRKNDKRKATKPENTPLTTRAQKDTVRDTAIMLYKYGSRSISNPKAALIAWIKKPKDSIEDRQSSSLDGVGSYRDFYLWTRPTFGNPAVRIVRNRALRRGRRGRTAARLPLYSYR